MIINIIHLILLILGLTFGFTYIWYVALAMIIYSCVFGGTYAILPKQTLHETLTEYPEYLKKFPDYPLLSVVFDVWVCVFLLYYGHMWLTVFYFIHILGYKKLDNVIREIKND